jgi:hypothetical protein
LGKTSQTNRHHPRQLGHPPHLWKNGRRCRAINTDNIGTEELKVFYTGGSESFGTAMPKKKTKKKPSRLEGLLTIMPLSLLTYSMCERKLSEALTEKNEVVATQTSKTTQKPTIHLVFNQF